jgi:hypothetical protein
MKSTSVKGNPAKKGSFTKYSGNVKSTGSALPKGDTVRKAGGKVSSNANVTKKAVAKKLSSKK